MYVFLEIIILVVLVSFNANAQDSQQPIGIFEDHFDFGNPIPPGDMSYNSETGMYEIIAGGVGETADGHGASLEVSGDVRCKATLKAIDLGGSWEHWAIVAIGISDDIGSDGIGRGGGCSIWCSIDNRLVTSGRYDNEEREYGEIVLSDVHEGKVELVRVGNEIKAYYIDKQNGQSVEFDSRTIDLEDPVIVTIWATSMQSGGTTKGIITDLELTVNGIIIEPASGVEDWALYK